MKGILIYQPTSKSAPLADFIDGLDPRLREKILLRLYFLTQLEKPEMKEPHFKRFSIERYRDLWELRVKSKVLIGDLDPGVGGSVQSLFDRRIRGVIDHQGTLKQRTDFVTGSGISHIHTAASIDVSHSFCHKKVSFNFCLDLQI